MFACANAIYFRRGENAIYGRAVRYLPAASDMRLRRVGRTTGAGYDTSLREGGFLRLRRVRGTGRDTIPVELMIYRLRRMIYNRVAVGDIHASRDWERRTTDGRPYRANPNL